METKITEWKRGDFYRSVAGPQNTTIKILTPGYVRGNFGVSQFCGNRETKWREWFIFHQPTGFLILNGEFKTKRRCCEFVDRLLTRGEWPKLAGILPVLNEFRSEMGIVPVVMRPIA